MSYLSQNPSAMLLLAPEVQMYFICYYKHLEYVITILYKIYGSVGPRARSVCAST